MALQQPCDGEVILSVTLFMDANKFGFNVWRPDLLVYVKPTDAALHLIHRHLATTLAESQNRTSIYHMLLYIEALRISGNTLLHPYVCY